MLLCVEGFGEIYKNNISEQKRDNINAEPNTHKYWQQVIDNQGRSKTKPMMALAVAEEMNSRGREGVPELLQEVIEQACNLARKSD